MEQKHLIGYATNSTQDRAQSNRIIRIWPKAVALVLIELPAFSSVSRNGRTYERRPVGSYHEGRGRRSCDDYVMWAIRNTGKPRVGGNETAILSHQCALPTDP